MMTTTTTMPKKPRPRSRAQAALIPARGSKAHAQRTADAKLLQSCVDLSGFSRRQFGFQLLARDERTLGRWLDLERPMPRLVREWLTRYLERAKQLGVQHPQQ